MFLAGKRARLLLGLLARVHKQAFGTAPFCGIAKLARFTARKIFAPLFSSAPSSHLLPRRLALAANYQLSAREAATCNRGKKHKHY
jgi:hypothetical protein